MAVETFGVDATHVASFEPQITVSATGPVTSARLTVMITASAARINGMMSFHGITPESVAGDTNSVEYANAQRLITSRVLIDLRVAAMGGVAIASETTSYDAIAMAEIGEWRAAPDILGAGVTDDVSPGVYTSTQAHDLNTADVFTRRRRRYDRKVNRNSNPDDRGGWSRGR